MPLRSGDVFAGYTVVRQLGAGANGEIYLTAHPQTLRQDALRVLPPAVSADHGQQARFQRRADMAATLWHPHIVGVHQRGEYRGLSWLAMDFVDGTDAAALVRDRYDTGMPADRVLDIVTSIADALDYAHGRHLVHGGVSAGAILLTGDRRRRVLLTDFGTPRSDDGDWRADQHGLAAAVYQLLSGTPPATTTAPTAVPPLGDTRPDLAAFDPALARAMAPDLRDRFDACLDFAAALRDAATAATQAQQVVDPAAAHAPTEHLANPTTGSGLPAVFVPAWSAEEPRPDERYEGGFEGEVEPEFASTMAAPALRGRPEPSYPAPSQPQPVFDGPPGGEGASGAGRIWAFTGVAALVALVVVLVVVARGGGDDGAVPGTAAPSSSVARPPPQPAATTTIGVEGRPRPAEIRGPDPTGEDCEGGFQITGQAGWASQGVRGSPAATCSFVGNVLKAYWDAADPSREPRSVVAAGAIPCAQGADCVGDDFFVTCSAEGSDPWITCRGGRDAVVILY